MREVKRADTGARVEPGPRGPTPSPLRPLRPARLGQEPESPGPPVTRKGPSAPGGQGLPSGRAPAPCSTGDPLRKGHAQGRGIGTPPPGQAWRLRAGPGRGTVFAGPCGVPLPRREALPPRALPGTAGSRHGASGRDERARSAAASYLLVVASTPAPYSPLAFRAPRFPGLPVDPSLLVLPEPVIPFKASRKRQEL